MPSMKLDTLIRNKDCVESYILFRQIEDWCLENIPSDRWKFQYSPILNVYGVDIPGGIIFKYKEDLAAFEAAFF